jgi:hypothetical protein
MFVTCRSKNSLFFVFDFLSNLDCGQWYKFWICQSHPTSSLHFRRLFIIFVCLHRIVNSCFRSNIPQVHMLATFSDVYIYIYPVTVWWIIHHPIQYIKNCWVRLLSDYNIKYICTIYTRLDTCLMSISRFSLQDKVTLRLLKLYFNIVDVVEWSRALDIRLSDWCCSVSMVWVQIPSREEQKFVSSKI